MSMPRPTFGRTSTAVIENAPTLRPTAALLAPSSSWTNSWMPVKNMPMAANWQNVTA
jgi:hypothetical protein